MNEQEIAERANAEIRRAAVSQPHAVRHRMLTLADFYTKGWEPKDEINSLVVDVPLVCDGKIIGYACTLYYVDMEGNPSASLELRNATFTERIGA
jgi:hypothetical protein